MWQTMNISMSAIPSQMVPLERTRTAPASIVCRREISRSPASFIPLLRIVFPTDPNRTSRKSRT